MTLRYFAAAVTVFLLPPSSLTCVCMCPSCRLECACVQVIIPCPYNRAIAPMHLDLCTSTLAPAAMQAGVYLCAGHHPLPVQPVPLHPYLSTCTSTFTPALMQAGVCQGSAEGWSRPQLCERGRCVFEPALVSPPQLHPAPLNIRAVMSIGT